VRRLCKFGISGTFLRRKELTNKAMDLSSRRCALAEQSGVLEYESVTSEQEPTGYVVEALIHSDFAKRGIGTQLLERAKALLAEKGVSSISAKRHEENKASEALLRKTGFQLIDVFPDPCRTFGSCRTAIERWSEHHFSGFCFFLSTSNCDQPG
jgi:ribosomal protein S18 acetylase RimI-like enzyme